MQYILDSVVNALAANPQRKFVYVEMSFFQRWYAEKSPDVRKRVKKLVHDGQLSFANGGWVMHDEAGSHYCSMIDQTTLGHRFLKEEFDYTPRVGWQIDPFGHSSTQASLLSSDVGFDSLFFGRIDYADIALRKANKQLEFIWRSSESKPYSEVFTGVFSDGNYQYPKGFCFDQVCRDEPVRNNPQLEDNNVDDIVKRFSKAVFDEKSVSAGNHIAFKMGSDFYYQNADKWFSNLDRLIDVINKNDPRFNVFYSSPVQYTDARAQEALNWTEKIDDFFPYADSEHAYWAGYFTSRPTFKYLERISSSFLQTLKQCGVQLWSMKDLSVKPSDWIIQWLSEKYSTLSSLADQSDNGGNPVFALTAAVGLVNHHDAITGTSKQHVVYDYVKILDKALSMAERSVASILSTLLFESKTSTTIPELHACRLMNESICDFTQNLGVDDKAWIVVHNTLPRSRSSQITVSLNQSIFSDAKAFIRIKNGATNEIVQSEYFKSWNNKDIVSVVFSASSVPSLSSKVFSIEISSSPCSLPGECASWVEESEWNLADASEDLVVSSDIVTLTFSRKNGLLMSMERKMNNGDNLKLDISNTIEYYHAYGMGGFKNVKDLQSLSFSGSLDHEMSLQKSLSLASPVSLKSHPHELLSGSYSAQPSGAYILRTSRPDEAPISTMVDSKVVVKVVLGKSFVEVRQVFSDWTQQVIRLRNGQEVAEVDWMVGPVPMDDHRGKEVLMIYQTDIENKGQIYTDSNGREFLARLKDFRPTYDLDVTEPIAGNYYPITAAAFIKDDARKAFFSVLTDRSEGVASLADGKMELLVHRRLTNDDWKGVGEPLDETTGGVTPYPDMQRIGDGITVSGRHYLLLSCTHHGVREVRTWMDQIFYPLTPFFGAKDSSHRLSQVNIAPSIAYDLPLNLHLLSLEQWSASEVLVRLSHQFAVNEDAENSKPITVDLSKLFQPLKYRSAMELSLSANQARSSMLKEKIRWKGPSSSLVDGSIDAAIANTLDAGHSIVTIYPMEIRTFLIRVD